MLLVVSPAKNLDFESAPVTQAHTQPELLEDSQVLIERCKQLSPAQIASMMKISDKLANLNADRFASWHLPFTLDNAKQAILAFNGDVYAGLSASEFSDEDFAFAQQHLRILSGLYGVLKPLDLMQPYRLEMGRKLELEYAGQKSQDLYSFWGDRITLVLNRAMAEQGDNVLVNLASNEYFGSVNKKALQGTIVTPVFKDWKNGQYKIISFYAKKARGLMARYVIQNQLTEIDQLTSFDVDGYEYDAAQSTPTQLVFTRKLTD